MAASISSPTSSMHQTTPRAPAPIPPSLRDTLKILLEEELYLPGIDLLNNLLAQGISRPPNGTNKQNTLIPPPIYISLLTTLLAHPHFTTHIPKTGRADRDFPLLTTHAERVLRRYLALAGSGGSGILEAWRFSERSGRRGVRDGSIGVGMMGESSEAFEDDKLDLRFALKESAFHRGEDFWAVVGWGFTCACAKGKGEKERWMKRRWEGAWRRWIGVIVEGLERDWVERGEVDDKHGEKEGAGGAGREGALVLKYLPETSGSAGVRRVARAIFANGKGWMAGEWREVWVGETEPPKSGKGRGAREEITSNKKGKKGSKSKRESLEENDDEDIGRVKLGVLEESEDDYFSGALDTAESPDGDTIEVGVLAALPPSATDTWGGVDAVELRRRIIMLLLDVCSNGLYLPSETLHQAFADHILPLSPPELPLFTRSFTLSTNAGTLIPAESHQKNLLALNQSLLDKLMESDALMPSEESEELNLKELVLCYLPYRAKSGKVMDNVKVGFLVEVLLRELLKRGGIEAVEKGWVSESLEKGIERRRVVEGKTSKLSGKRGEEERVARKELEEGERRLRMWVEVGWGSMK